MPAFPLAPVMAIRMLKSSVRCTGTRLRPAPDGARVVGAVIRAYLRESLCNKHAYDFLLLSLAEGFLAIQVEGIPDNARESSLYCRDRGPVQNADQPYHDAGHRSPALATGARPRRRAASMTPSRISWCLNYLDLAESLAARFATRGRERSDLVQVAYLGLVKAARGFDEDKGESFPAYAAPTINGELKRFLRDRCWTVRPPRRVQDVRTQLLAHRTGPDPGAGPRALDPGTGAANSGVSADGRPGGPWRRPAACIRIRWTPPIRGAARRWRRPWSRPIRRSSAWKSWSA